MFKKAISLTLVFAFTFALIPMPAKAQGIGLPVEDIQVGNLLIRATYTPVGDLAHVAAFENGVFLGAFAFDQITVTETDVTTPVVFQSSNGKIVTMTSKASRHASPNGGFDVDLEISDSVSGNSLMISTKTLESNLLASGGNGDLFHHQKVAVEYKDLGILDPNSRVYNLLINVKGDHPANGVVLLEPQVKYAALREAILQNTEFADVLRGYISLSGKIGATAATPGALMALMFVFGQPEAEDIGQIIQDLIQSIVRTNIYTECLNECVADGMLDQAQALATAALACLLGSTAGCAAGASICLGIGLGCGIGCGLGSVL